MLVFGNVNARTVGVIDTHPRRFSLLSSEYILLYNFSIRLNDCAGYFAGILYKDQTFKRSHRKAPPVEGIVELAPN